MNTNDALRAWVATAASTMIVLTAACSAAPDASSRGASQVATVSAPGGATGGTAPNARSGAPTSSSPLAGQSVGAAATTGPLAGSSANPGFGAPAPAAPPPAAPAAPGGMAVAGAAAPPPAAAAPPMPTAPANAGPPIAATGDCAGATIAPMNGEYSANGPFPTQVVNNTGPMGQYTVYRPTMLGDKGFKHPIATWGNGITTDPTFYPGLLGAIASQGIVVIASNSTTVSSDLMVAGLDWMIMQNSTASEYQGKLNPTCLVSVGYSLGGGGAVGAGAHANVVATVSMHGVSGPSNVLHSPLLLLTAETDTVCVPAQMVTPTFDLSSVQTFYGTISSAADSGNQGHLIPVDGALAIITPPELNMAERAAVIAWLRLWVYGDQGAKRYFYPDDCTLCKAPWVKPQRKMWK